MNVLWRLIGNNKRKHERLEKEYSTTSNYEKIVLLNAKMDELDKELESLENWENVIQSIGDLVGAFNRLEKTFEKVDEEQLQKYIEVDYPFEKDFFTMSNDVYMWAMNTIRKISEQE